MKKAWLFAALLLAVAAKGGEAQYSCGNMEDYCGFLSRGHKVPGPTNGEFRYSHINCEDCRIGDEYFTGEYCHGPCANFSAFNDVYNAAQRGDVALVLALAPYATGTVGINLARNTVQITTCSGLVIANLRLPFDWYLPQSTMWKRWDAQLVNAFSWFTSPIVNV